MYIIHHVYHLGDFSACRRYHVRRDIPAASHGFLASIVLSRSSSRARPLWADALPSRNARIWSCLGVVVGLLIGTDLAQFGTPVNSPFLEGAPFAPTAVNWGQGGQLR